jgi:hypothetical protein
MRFISTGQPSTLKTYRQIALFLSQDDSSEAVQFFDKKIKEQGEDTEVIADEQQMMFLIAHMITSNTQIEEEDD